MHLFILALAMQCILPIFDLSSADFFGLSLVNRDAQVREFTVTATPADGANPRTNRLTVGAVGQRALLLSELFPPSGLSSGALTIDSTAGDCPVYTTLGSSQALTGTDGATVFSDSIYLPHIEVNTGFVELAHTDTVVGIINSTTASTSVTVQLVNFDGTVRGSTVTFIPGKGTSIFRISESFQQVLPNNSLGGKTFQGYARVRGFVGLAAWQRIDTPLSSALIRGRAAEEIVGASVAMIPHFVFGGTYGSSINLINVGTNSVLLELSANDESGNRIGETVELTLHPGQGKRAAVGELFRVAIPAIFPPPVITGYIRIRERLGATFRLAGDIEISNLQGAGKQSSMLAAISDSVSGNWLVPFVSSESGYFTGYAIANPNELLTVQTDVTIQIVNPDGTIHSTTRVSLSPRSRTTAMIPPGIATGYLRITANMPIHVLGAIGTVDGRLLKAIPALPNSP